MGTEVLFQPIYEHLVNDCYLFCFKYFASCEVGSATLLYFNEYNFSFFWKTELMENGTVSRNSGNISAFIHHLMERRKKKLPANFAITIFFNKCFQNFPVLFIEISFFYLAEKMKLIVYNQKEISLGKKSFCKTYPECL